eukprot:5115750-Alexandrium_andersonii.AAC.1
MSTECRPNRATNRTDRIDSAGRRPLKLSKERLPLECCPPRLAPSRRSLPFRGARTPATVAL